MGPVLFVIFVKDIPRSVSLKFADDAIALAIGDSDKEVEEKLQAAASELSLWCEESGMVLNVPKVKVMNFSKGPKVKFNVTLTGEAVKYVSSTKSLGVVLDEDLSLNCRLTAYLVKLILV